jgi:hypothetical protein
MTDNSKDLISVDNLKFFGPKFFRPIWWKARTISTKDLLLLLKANGTVGSFHELNKIKYEQQNYINLEDLKEVISSNFDENLINIKISFLLFFIIASFIIKDTEYIKNHLGKFIAETIIYAFAVAIAFVYIILMRDQTKSAYMTAGKWFGIVFIGMIIINILLQLSGFYSIMFDHEVEKPSTNSSSKSSKKYSSTLSKEQEKTKEPEKPELQPISKFEKKLLGLNNSLYIILFIILFIYILYLVIAGFSVYDFEIANYMKSNNNMMFYVWWLLEILIFGLCNSLPFIYIYMNREHTGTLKTKLQHSLFETLLLFIKMAILHVLLQSSGFYRGAMGLE